MIIRSVLNNYVIIPKSIPKSNFKGPLKQFVSIKHNDKTSHDFLFHLVIKNNKYIFNGIDGNLTVTTMPHYGYQKIIKGIYKQHDNNFVYKFTDIKTRMYSSEIELIFKNSISE